MFRWTVLKLLLVRRHALSCTPPFRRLSVRLSLLLGTSRRLDYPGRPPPRQPFAAACLPTLGIVSGAIQAFGWDLLLEAAALVQQVRPEARWWMVGEDTYGDNAAYARRLRDQAPAVRRQAALSLGWCGGARACRCC